MTVKSVRVEAIAPSDLRQYVGLDQPDVFRPVETKLPGGAEAKWRFPAGAVAAVELEIL